MWKNVNEGCHGPQVVHTTSLQVPLAEIQTAGMLGSTIQLCAQGEVKQVFGEQ